MLGCFVFVNVGKPSDRLAEDIVGLVIVHGRDLPDQHIAALAPEGVPVAGLQSHAFTGFEFQLLARGKVAPDAIAPDRAAAILGKVAVVVGAGQAPGEGVGNGRATALTFAREGATVVCVDRDLAAAEATVLMFMLALSAEEAMALMLTDVCSAALAIIAMRWAVSSAEARMSSALARIP